MEGDNVIYYTGCISNYSSTHVGEATTNVLGTDGLEIILHEERYYRM